VPAHMNNIIGICAILSYCILLLLLYVLALVDTQGSHTSLEFKTSLEKVLNLEISFKVLEKVWNLVETKKKGLEFQHTILNFTENGKF